VAIKVLPEGVSSARECLARFDRAKTLASLNHPHIAANYCSERSADTTALVTNLVEGPMLADRGAGANPLDLLGQRDIKRRREQGRNAAMT
jgi:hypothetical protein